MNRITETNYLFIYFLFDKRNFNTDCMDTLSLFSVLDLTN